MSATFSSDDLASARAEARRLLDVAHAHKKASNSHRSKAKLTRARLAELEKRWARFGVQLIEEDTPSPEGGPSDRADETA